MNESKLEIKSEKENKGEKVIKEEKNLFNSTKNLINVKKYESNLKSKNVERKSTNSADNKKDKKNQNEDIKPSLTLNNLSNLYKSYIQLKNNNPKNSVRKSTILPVFQMRKRISIDEKEEVLNKNLLDNLNLYTIITDRISDVKRAALQYLDETKNKLEIKYSIYINDVNKLLLEKEKKISKLLYGSVGGDNFIKYANHNLFEQLDDILQIHEYIFSALEDHFNLLLSFLEQSNLINQKKPIEHFIYKNSKDILNSWIMNKFDFNQIDLSKIISNIQFSDLFAGYFSKMKNNEYSSISLEKNSSSNLPLEIELMNKNICQIKKIKFLGLNNDDIININKDIYKIKKDKKFINQARKVRSLSIINCDFQSDNKTDNQIKIAFPSLNSFKMKNSLINTSYLFQYIITDSNNLIKLHFEKVGLTDNDLKIFFTLLSKKTSVQNTLKSLSFKGNLLTKITIDNFNMNDHDENVFKNLQYLDLSKNNIYEFSEKIT